MSGELIDTLVARPLSVADMKRKLCSVGRESTKVLIYSDLAKYSSLMQLLRPEGMVMLYRQTPTYWHWVAMIPGPDIGTVSYFDSYGFDIDEPLGDVDPSIRSQLGQTQPLLSMLVQRAIERGEIDNVDVNSHRLQTMSSEVADCWGYALLRVLWNQMSNDEFVAWLTDRSGPGSVADRNVALLTALV